MSVRSGSTRRHLVVVAGFAGLSAVRALRARLFVAMQWFYSYLSFGRGARLIGGTEGDAGDWRRPAAPSARG